MEWKYSKNTLYAIQKCIKLTINDFFSKFIARMHKV